MTRPVLLVPGRMFGPYVPLLYYAAEAAEARGATVEPLYWPGHPEPVVVGAAAPAMVADHVRAAVTAMGADRPVLVAKSLGTLAAPVARELGLPAIWFTPVMTGRQLNDVDPAVFVDAVAARTAPALLVGGTADALWDGARARQLSDDVLEVQGADHMMQLPGPLSASAAVLGTVADAVERFLDATL